MKRPSLPSEPDKGRSGLPGSRISLLGVPVDLDSPERILERLVARASSGTPTRVFYANAHILNLAAENELFRELLASADIVLPDGYGVCVGARWLGLQPPQRMAITDYIWDFASLCANTGTSTFIVGGQPGIAERAARELQARFPDLEVLGTHHGYLGEPGATAELIAQVRAARPDTICVGMGSPLQEAWIARHQSDLSVPVVFAVGAVMDHVSGEVTRPRPRWMIDNGLEWVGRLAAEPKRMWRRYLVGNPRFLFRVARERLRRRTGRQR